MTELSISRDENVNCMTTLPEIFCLCKDSRLYTVFPINCLFSYACTVVTSRPARCMSTSRIWDGKTIKRNTQGNSALYILEDEVILDIIFCLDKEKKLSQEL